jgi:Site-specific recombinase XerD
MIVADEFITWAETYRKPFIQYATWVKYLSTESHLRLLFPNKTIKQLSKMDVQQAFNKLGEKLQKRTIKTVHQHFKSFIGEMYDDGKIKLNIANNIRIGGVEKAKSKNEFLEIAEREKLLNSLDLMNPKDLMIYIALLYGLRFAEVLGLQVIDIIKEGNVNDGCLINIIKTMDYKYTKSFKETKTKDSVRDVPLSKVSYQHIRKYIKHHKLEQHDCLFPMTFPSSLNRYLSQKCKKLDIPRISFHGLRHTCGSYLLKNGIPMITVSEILGHADMDITQKIYIHLLDEQRNDDRKMILRLLNKELS